MAILILKGKSEVQAAITQCCTKTTNFGKNLPLNYEVASVTLRNVHKENNRAKSECSFAHLFFKLSLGFGLDFESGLGFMVVLDFGLGLGMGLGKGPKLTFLTTCLSGK